LVTLGLVVDGSGFVRRSRVFEGNVAECTTLETMLAVLSAPAGSMVVMDRGIATQANIDWLVSHNYRYLVVSREKTRHFAEDQSVSLTSATGTKIHIQREEDGREVRLRCYSEDRARKDEAIATRFCKRFEEGLGKIAESLTKPRGTKKRDKVLERIGRLKEKSHGVGQHYVIDLQYDEKNEMVTRLTWRQETKTGSQLSHPGVYCLRTNEMTWDEAALWRTYTMLTDLEAVFRCLKSELGLRPIYHHKEERSDGHLFITVLAYQVVQVIRRKLKVYGVRESWSSLRRIFTGQQRITASFRQKDGRTLHVRKATVAEPKLKQLYEYLQISEAPGGVSKFIN
jgi:transposase